MLVFLSVVTPTLGRACTRARVSHLSTYAGLINFLKPLNFRS